MSRYLSPCQQRVLKMIRVLSGRECTGLAPSEIAKGMRISASNVTRDLANLKEAGLAEEIPNTGRWRLGPFLIQAALAHSLEVNRHSDALDEVKQRYSRTPN
jgi:DNA-binding IclR family transcriptional regulator